MSPWNYSNARKAAAWAGSPRTLLRRSARLKCISLPQKEKLAEEIHRRQPYLLASCIVQPKLGAHVNDVEFLLNILLVFYQALCRQ
jgi:hypothetical protein